MVFRISFLMIFVVFLTSLLAQSNNLQINVNPMSDSSSDYEMNFSWQSSNSPQDGFSLVIPGQIRVVPMGVRVDNQDLHRREIR